MNLLVLNSGGGSHKGSLFRRGNTWPMELLEKVWKAVIMASDPGSTAQEVSLTIEWGLRCGTESLPADLSSKQRVEYLLKRLKEDKSSILKGNAGSFDSPPKSSGRFRGSGTLAD